MKFKFISRISGFCRFTFLIISFLSYSNVVFSSEIPKLWQPFRITPRMESRHIDLSGTWELSHMDTPVLSVAELQNRKDPFDTQVPNSVHWSYFKAGKLPHPYAHLNALQYQWMEEKAWYYKKEVTIPEDARGNYVMLCFDGVDYFSRVWVNDSLVGEHEGMFGGPDIDITRLIRYGRGNTIWVEVRAGNWGNRKNYKPRGSGKIIKPWIISGDKVGTKEFFSLGMWQGARIELLPDIHLERPYLTTGKATRNEALLHLSLEILARKTSFDYQLHPWNNTIVHHPGPGGIPFVKADEKATLLVEFIDGSSILFSQEFPLELYEGRNWLKQDIVLPRPRLWNPNGMGDQNLYNVRLTLEKEGNPIDKLEFEFGIRTIERVATAGPQTSDRWENWQFIVNGRKLFVKGMNWIPADVLLDLPEERYHWALQAAKNMGVQLIRVWGGGLLETDDFYHLCNEMGMMVWQDFPIGNQDTPDFPQDIWEAQVVQNIFRLRNHPCLAVWCGGNEFNPYSFGNAATIGILERNLDIFDKSRLFVRTTPDDGSLHTYPDMDPCRYNQSFKFEPWVSETGMHSMPESNLFYELVDNKEFFDLGKMWDKNFSKGHPEFIHHFAEFSPDRVPRMLSRASHIDDLSDPTIEAVTEATQIGAGEFYQIFSEKMQGNYPVTAGLMPWVFKRPWPVVAIQLMDWFGQPVAPYYFLKRTYESTHVSLDLQRLVWAPGETISLKGKIIHAGESGFPAIISVNVYDDSFHPSWSDERETSIQEGPAVMQTDLGEYHIPTEYRDRFLLIITELKNKSGELISRSLYYPRILAKMEDQEFHDKYLNEPLPWITLDKGPWLKPTVAKNKTTIEVSSIQPGRFTGNMGKLSFVVKNSGEKPAFMTQIDITGCKRLFTASDNFFWLAPGESKIIETDISLREEHPPRKFNLEVKAWNAKARVNEVKF